jgi:hypothetical protein
MPGEVRLVKKAAVNGHLRQARVGLAQGSAREFQPVTEKVLGCCLAGCAFEPAGEFRTAHFHPRCQRSHA